MKRVAGFIGSGIRKSGIAKEQERIAAWCAEHEMTVTEWLGVTWARGAACG